MRDFLQRLRRLTPHGSFDLAAVFTGSFTRNLLRGLFKLLIAGFLGVAGLGVLRPIHSLFKMTTRLVDFALDYASVTFVAAAIKKGETDERDRILASVLFLKLWITAALLIVGNVVAPMIAASVLGDAELTLYVRLAFIAVGGQLLWRYVSGYFSAHQQFGRLAFFLTTVPILMLASAGALVLTGRLTLSAAIVIDLLAPAVCVIVWWPAIRRGMPSLGCWTRGSVRKILRFSRWVYVSEFASGTRNNLNTILLKNPGLSGSVSAGEINAGLYSFGNDLANEVTVLSQTMISVLLPKASRKTEVPKLRRFVRRSYTYLALAAVPLILLVFAAKPMILALGYFKATYLDYLPSLHVFAVLYIGALFSVFSIPMKTALYSMKLPQMESWIELCTIPLLVVASILLIPRFGGEGAAYAVLAQRLIAFAAVMGYGVVKLRQPGEAS